MSSLSSTLITSDKRKSSDVAIYIAIISFAMLFLTLFFVYAVFRFTSSSWQSAVNLLNISIFLPTIATIVLVLGSIVYTILNNVLLSASILKRRTLLFLCFFSGILFAIIQFKYWMYLKSLGLMAGTNIFTSIVYTFTWVHAIHIAFGLLLLLWVLPLFKLNVNVKKYTLFFKNVAKFWHFLCIIWLLIYFTVFVL